MYMSTEARLRMRHHEKKVMKYYDDGGPGRGNCTWGIGTKAHNGPCTAEELARKVTNDDVEREFLARVRVAESGVLRNVKIQLTQAQFDALVSLAYNAGIYGSRRVFELVNAGDFEAAARVIASMTHGHERRNGKRVKVHYRGLGLRRAEEAAAFRNSASAPLRSAAK